MTTIFRVNIYTETAHMYVDYEDRTEAERDYYDKANVLKVAGREGCYATLERDGKVIKTTKVLPFTYSLRNIVTGTIIAHDIETYEEAKFTAESFIESYEMIGKPIAILENNTKEGTSHLMAIRTYTELQQFA